MFTRQDINRFVNDANLAGKKVFKKLFAYKNDFGYPTVRNLSFIKFVYLLCFCLMLLWQYIYVQYKSKYIYYYYLPNL